MVHSSSRGCGDYHPEPWIIMANCGWNPSIALVPLPLTFNTPNTGYHGFIRRPISGGRHRWRSAVHCNLGANLIQSVSNASVDPEDVWTTYRFWLFPSDLYPVVSSNWLFTGKITASQMMINSRRFTGYFPGSPSPLRIDVKYLLVDLAIEHHSLMVSQGLPIKNGDNLPKGTSIDTRTIRLNPCAWCPRSISNQLGTCRT